MNTSGFLPYLVWLGPVLFFAYQFVMRIAPGLVMPELMQKFNVNASEFGLFASLYYVGYAGMQIPVALLLDKFGPRKVITLSAVVCSIATLALIYTNDWKLALLSRFLIGAGSAAGFLGVSKVISLLFSKEKYTRMVGFSFTLGLMGALYGGKPLGSLIQVVGFEKVLILVGCLGFLIATFIYLTLRDGSTETNQKAENPSILFDLKKIVLNKELLMIAFANFLMVGALEGFADVWGVSYLVTSRGIEKSEAALLTSTIFFGMLFGGPALAYFSNKMKSESALTAACGLLMALLFFIMLNYNSNLSNALLYVLFFATGILCCYQVLVFSMGSNLVPIHLRCVTVAFLNCINMLGGSFFHSSIGNLMDYFWSGSMNNGLKFYDENTYVYALSIIPIASVLGSLILIFRKKLFKITSTNTLMKEEKHFLT